MPEIAKVSLWGPTEGLRTTASGSSLSGFVARGRTKVIEGVEYTHWVDAVPHAGRQEPGRVNRAFYSDSIFDFLERTRDEIIGVLATANDFPLEQTQRDAWLEEIQILRLALPPYQGSIYFEYSIPRMGRRIDTVLLIGPVIFVLEFKAGEREFTAHALDQVVDYALDLKNFHEPSHNCFIAPILIATGRNQLPAVSRCTGLQESSFSPHQDQRATARRGN